MGGGWRLIFILNICSNQYLRDIQRPCFRLGTLFLQSQYCRRLTSETNMMPAAAGESGQGSLLRSPAASPMYSEDTTGGAAFEDADNTTASASNPYSRVNLTERDTIVLKTHDGDGYVLPYLPWDASPPIPYAISVTDPIVVNKSSDRGDLQASTPRPPSASH